MGRWEGEWGVGACHVQCVEAGGEGKARGEAIEDAGGDDDSVGFVEELAETFGPGEGGYGHDCERVGASRLSFRNVP